MVPQKSLAKIKTAFDEAQNVLILLHLFPDGDTICSSLALSYYFEKMGKNVACAVKQKIPSAFSYIPGVSKIKNDFLLGDYDTIIAVDCGDANRTGYPIRLEQISKNNHTLINIDHHTHNNLQKIASINLVEENAAATAEVVWDILNYLEAKIDSNIATYILAGIYYDTGGFYHPNVSSKTLQIASDCLRCGGRMGLISDHANISKTSQTLKLWGLALKRMKIKPNGIVYSILTQKDMKDVGAKDEDASGVINLINTIDEARVAILFVETSDGTIKASLRTESDSIDVADLARVFGGGGHKKASGFTIDGKFVQTEDGWEVSSA